jgi:hypothetical protein
LSAWRRLPSEEKDGRKEQCEPEAFEATESEEEVGGSDMSTTLTAKSVSSVDIDTRVAAVDRASASTQLDGYGWAILRNS